MSDWKFGDVVRKTEETSLIVMVLAPFSNTAFPDEEWHVAIGLSTDNKGWNGYEQGNVASIWDEWWELA